MINTQFKLNKRDFEDRFNRYVSALPLDMYTLSEFEDCISSIEKICKQNKYKFYEIESQDDIDSLDLRFVHEDSEIEIGDIVCLDDNNIVYLTDYFEYLIEISINYKGSRLEKLMNLAHLKLMLQACNEIDAA